MAADHRLNIHLRVIRRAEHLNDAADGGIVAPRIMFDLDLDHIPRLDLRLPADLDRPRDRRVVSTPRYRTSPNQHCLRERLVQRRCLDWILRIFPRY